MSTAGAAEGRALAVLVVIGAQANPSAVNVRTSSFILSAH